ncbi:MAG: phosphomannomutase, partial [Pseudomonadota bacterium]
PEIRIDVPEERKFAIVHEARDRLAGLSDIAVNDIDGVRVTNADGWWLLRASNTQNALVVRCEAADERALEGLKEQVRGQLRASGLEPPDF